MGLDICVRKYDMIIKIIICIILLLYSFFLISEGVKHYNESDTSIGILIATMGIVFIVGILTGILK